MRSLCASSNCITFIVAMAGSRNPFGREILGWQNYLLTDPQSRVDYAPIATSSCQDVTLRKVDRTQKKYSVIFGRSQLGSTIASEVHEPHEHVARCGVADARSSRLGCYLSCTTIQRFDDELTK